jgi:arylsulfatase
MTGTWPHINGCIRNSVPLDRRFRVFPELMEDKDYRTAYMGKWHLGEEGPAGRGFHEWISTDDRGDYTNYLISRGITPDKPNGRFSELAISNLPFELSRPKFLERHACIFTEKHQRDPFVLVVGFVEPHSPYNGPLNDEHPLDEIDLDLTATAPESEDIPLRYRLMREWQQAEAILDRERLPTQLFFGITPEEYRSIKQRYLGLVTLVDQSIGAILGYLERFGLSDNTIVVHTSDHGDSLGARHLFGKETMFEQAARVPLLIRLPNQTRGKIILRPVSHVNFVPTLLDLLGQPNHPKCVGASIYRAFGILHDRLLLPIDEKKYHKHSKAVDVRRILGRIWDNTFKVWHCPQSMGPDGIFISLVAHACGAISFAGGTMCPDRKNGSFAGFIQSEFGLGMINE